MIEAANSTRKEFLESQIGRSEAVLFEQTDKNGLWVGYTKNYTPVKIKSDKPLNGMILNVKLCAVNGDFCIGEPE